MSFIETMRINSHLQEEMGTALSPLHIRVYWRSFAVMVDFVFSLVASENSRHSAEENGRFQCICIFVGVIRKTLQARHARHSTEKRGKVQGVKGKRANGEETAH